MKKAFVFGLFVILAITACQAEQEILIREESKVFTASIEEDFGGYTKTSLGEQGHVLWKQGDQLSIFAGSTINEQYRVTDESDGKTFAVFNKVGSPGFVAGTDIDNNVAFYAYASSAAISKSGSNYVISGIELPATQTYAAGSFGNGVFPMAAVTSTTEDMNLKFRNVLGGLKLQLKGTATITSISVSGNNDEILCGDAVVTATHGGVPAIALSDASARTVTLDCGAGVTLDPETVTPFIIALPPMAMTGGFTVIVTDSDSGRMEIKTTKSQTFLRTSLLKMPEVTYAGVGAPPVNYAEEPFTITAIGEAGFCIGEYTDDGNGMDKEITLEYRINSGNWMPYTIGSVISLADGEYLQFSAGAEGNSSFSKSFAGLEKYYGCWISGNVKASGNIMSLLDRTLQRGNVPKNAFANFFKGQAGLVDASDLYLPATALAKYCYAGMFSNCTGLAAAPELPATTLAKYCYYAMFSGCTGLTVAPELPATTLAKYCYYAMFYGCTGLTTAPELPATTLADNCYSWMFCYCSSLNYIKALFQTTPSSSYTHNWVYGVAETGTFVKSSSAVWDVTGYSGVPSGWTVNL